MRSAFVGIAILCVVLLAPAKGTVAAPPDQVIADFDSEVASPTGAEGVEVSLIRDGAGGPDGTDMLARVVPVAGRGRQHAVVFQLAPDLKPAASSGVAAALRIPGDGDTYTLRWTAFDAGGNLILQRKLELRSGDAAHDVAVPWANWRWGNATGGGRSEVRTLKLFLDPAVPELELDDLRLLAAPTDAPTPTEWLRRLAFAERDVRMAEAGGLLVATDATKELTDADLRRILSRMRKARLVVKRLFGDAVRPLDPETTTPAALLIFRDAADYPAFFERLGAAWGATIVAPKAGGYTVQDIAATTFDPKQGAHRPVFFHESVHAVLAHDVRLLTHSDHQSWLHEALANYLQVCLFPRSLDARILTPHFSKPMLADGRGFFQPFEVLLAKHADPRRYAQLATVMAFLVEKRPDLLSKLARATTGGHPALDALRMCGTSAAALEAEWFAWGRERFAAGADARAAFPPPKEFAPEPAAP